MKNTLSQILLMLTLSGFLINLSSCHDYVEYANDPYGNFDALWTAIDEHYCFFEYKNTQQESEHRT